MKSAKHRAQTESDPQHRLRRLIATFPCLARAPGIAPWEPLLLDGWAASDAPSHGEACAARFVLAVWNLEEAGQCGPFDLIEALRVWDTLHQEAFLAWVRAPWWA